MGWKNLLILSNLATSSMPLFSYFEKLFSSGKCGLASRTIYDSLIGAIAGGAEIHFGQSIITNFPSKNIIRTLQGSGTGAKTVRGVVQGVVMQHSYYRVICSRFYSTVNLLYCKEKHMTSSASLAPIVDAISEEAPCSHYFIFTPQILLWFHTLTASFQVYPIFFVCFRGENTITSFKQDFSYNLEGTMSKGPWSTQAHIHNQLCTTFQPSKSVAGVCTGVSTFHSGHDTSARIPLPPLLCLDTLNAICIN